MPTRCAPPVTTRLSPVHRPRQAHCLATLGPDLTGLHFRLGFHTPHPVNVTLRHKRDSELAVTCIRARTVSDNQLATLARTSPQPVPPLIRSSSPARFSSIIPANRDSETLARFGTSGDMPRLHSPTAPSNGLAVPGAPIIRADQRNAFPPPSSIIETLRHRRDSEPTPPRPTCDTCSPGMSESPTLPA
jgi:hypothetical protein